MDELKFSTISLINQVKGLVLLSLIGLGEISSYQAV